MESYNLNRTKDYNLFDKAFRPYSCQQMHPSGSIIGLLQEVLEEHYDILYDFEDRTNFWEQWCVVKDGKLLLPDDNGYLARAFISWSKELLELEVSNKIILDTMLSIIFENIDDRDDPPQWLFEIEVRWGQYQEECQSRN